MNKANILAVADAIEQHSIPDLGFNMGDFFSEGGFPDLSGHNCGTTACIGGWATRLMGRSRWPNDADICEWLGIDTRSGDYLFYAFNHPYHTSANAKAGWFERIQPQQAVAVLRHLAETGEVDWSIGAPEASKP